MEDYLLDGRPDETYVEFPFTIAEEGYYSFITKQYEDIPGDTVLTIYDVNDNMIARYDHDLFDTLNISLEVGDYTLVVSDYEDNDVMVCLLDIALLQPVY